MKILKIGKSQKDLDQYAKFGIRYDKKTTKAYLMEYENPSIISNEDVIELEGKLGVPLPQGYRDFLLKTNGGNPEVAEIQIPSRGASTIQCFYPLKSRIENITLNYEIFENYINRIPSSCIPIACDPAGNQFLLGIRGEDINNIYFWDHEMEADDEPQPYRKNIILLSKSFYDFEKEITNNQ